MIPGFMRNSAPLWSRGQDAFLKIQGTVSSRPPTKAVLVILCYFRQHLNCNTGLLTLINTAPFGTLITMGVVPTRLHTCYASQVAHLYDAGVFRIPNKGFPANFPVTSAKLTFLESHFRPLIEIRS